MIPTNDASHSPAPGSPAPGSSVVDSPGSESRKSAEAERFERVASDFDGLVRATPADRWSAPTPCDGWNALDVVAHVVETQCDLLARMGFAAPDIEGLDPITAWAQTRSAIAAAMADPVTAGHAYDGFFGPTTFERTVDQFYSFDLVIHRWDLARATGLVEHEGIADDLLPWLRSSAEGFGDALRMPGICGAAIELDGPASAQDQLLAWLGRNPGWRRTEPS